MKNQNYYCFSAENKKMFAAAKIIPKEMNIDIVEKIGVTAIFFL